MSNCTNKTFNVAESGNVEIQPGAYPATFQGLSDPEDKGNGNGPYRTLTFTDGDKTYLGFADDVPPTINNKIGRFLMGLAGLPLKQSASITPSQYVGKRYMLVYGHNKNRNVTLQSISPTQQ